MALPLPVASGWLNFAAGATMIALAAGLTFLSGATRLHRVLAVFLVLRGAMNVIEGYGHSFTASPASVLDRVHVYFDIAVVFAAAAFATVFRRRYGPAPPRARSEAIWLAAFLLGGLACIGAYVAQPALYFAEGGELAPFALFAPLRIILYAVIAVLIARDAARAQGARAEAGELVALGFLLTPLFGPPPPSVIQSTLADPVGLLPRVLLLSGGGLALGLVAWITVLRSSAAAGRLRVHRWTLATGAGAIASGVAAAAVVIAAPAAAEGLYRVLDGVWTLALPLFVAYAVVRHQLFDLDVRIRWTLSRGTLAAIFVAAFFVASELSAQLFSDYTGSAVAGILTAGLLVFALTPLQAFAERVALAAVPDARPPQAWTPQERAEFYREQARLAWADGALTREERRMLDAARARLGLSHEDAARIEAETAGG
ncbi:MAG TPA: hypothetical protein VM582_06165 [Candidatus Thermoplasmatota archaeon]|nr:hypothetical protein [Candidatus Thermoplasmatota archaeon]